MAHVVREGDVPYALPHREGAGTGARGTGET